jgi:Flp pilus assembly protein TadG
MLNLIRRRREKGEKGQALVEFALLVPIFLILVFAIVDFGMGFHAWISVTNAAREGARLGSVQASMEDIDARTRETADTAACSPLDVEVVGAQGSPGDSVSVSVDCQYDLITPLASLLGDIFGPTLTFSSTAEMRLE